MARSRRAAQLLLLLLLSATPALGDYLITTSSFNGNRENTGWVGCYATFDRCGQVNGSSKVSCSAMAVRSFISHDCSGPPIRSAAIVPSLTIQSCGSVCSGSRRCNESQNCITSCSGGTGSVKTVCVPYAGATLPPQSWVGLGEATYSTPDCAANSLIEMNVWPACDTSPPQGSRAFFCTATASTISFYETAYVPSRNCGGGNSFTMKVSDLTTACISSQSGVGSSRNICGGASAPGASTSVSVGGAVGGAFGALSALALAIFAARAYRRRHLKAMASLGTTMRAAAAATEKCSNSKDGNEVSVAENPLHASSLSAV